MESEGTSYVCFCTSVCALHNVAGMQQRNDSSRTFITCRIIIEDKGIISKQKYGLLVNK